MGQPNLFNKWVGLTHDPLTVNPFGFWVGLTHLTHFDTPKHDTKYYLINKRSLKLI